MIDNVLVPPQNVTLTALAVNLTSLVGALDAAELGTTVEGLSNVAIFAQTNKAFQSISLTLQNLSTEDLASIKGLKRLPKFFHKYL